MTDFPTGVPFDEALAIIREVAARYRLAAEPIALGRTHGRVLARDVATPPFDNSVRHADDGCAGDPVLRAGHVLTPTRVALAASLGLASLEVTRKPTVAVFTSGDELIEPGMPLTPGQAYDSSRELLMGLLRADGLEPTAWPRLPDDPKRIEIALRDAGCAFDLILTCGGVSAGENAPIPAVLAQFGQVHFCQVKMEPGMPLLFGSLDQARLLGFPGNPATVLATYLTLGRALIDGLQGRAERRPTGYARLTQPIDNPHPSREFLPARLRADDSGCLLAEPIPASGTQRPQVEPNALIVVPEGPRRLPVDAVVEVLGYA